MARALKFTGSPLVERAYARGVNMPAARDWGGVGETATNRKGLLRCGRLLRKGSRLKEKIEKLMQKMQRQRRHSRPGAHLGR